MGGDRIRVCVNNGRKVVYLTKRERILKETKELLRIYKTLTIRQLHDFLLRRLPRNYNISPRILAMHYTKDPEICNVRRGRETFYFLRGEES